MRRVLTAVLLLAALTTACRRAPQTGYSRLSGVQVAWRAKPGTVNINTDYEATVDVADFDVDTKRLHADAQRRMPPQASREQALSTVYSTLLADPGNYLVNNGKTRSVKTKAKSLGSGLVITPDGYVVTNAHVVEPDEEEIKGALVASVKSLVDADTTELETGLASVLPGTTLSDEDKARFRKVLVERHTKTARVADLKSEVFAVIGYTGSGDNVEIFRKACKLEKVGKPTPGKDVAICKMDGDDFPTLPLASGLDAGGVQTGADLFIMGFPGELAFESSFSQASRLDPTYTVGHVSGIKEVSEEKWKAIQTDASISPGNSGGPAFTDTGRVVGLATFTVDGERTQNLNFVVSVDVVQEFLRDLHVVPAQSSFTSRYLQALDAYERQDKPRALSLLRALNVEHPESAVVRDLMHRLNSDQPLSDPRTVSSRTESRPIPERKSGGSPKIVFILIVGLLVIIIAVVILANRG